MTATEIDQTFTILTDTMCVLHETLTTLTEIMKLQTGSLRDLKEMYQNLAERLETVEHHRRQNP